MAVWYAYVHGTQARLLKPHYAQLDEQYTQLVLRSDLRGAGNNQHGLLPAVAEQRYT